MFRRSYSTAVNGLKVSASDSQGHLSKLIVKVNAGSRYPYKCGSAHLLSRFNFQNTTKKSALRFARESELLGGYYSSQITRDAIILAADFQKEDLPYFVNSLADIISGTEFKVHEFEEVVLPAAQHDFHVASSSPEFLAKETLYHLVFRDGLGKPLLFDGVSRAGLEDIKKIAADAYTKANIEIIGTGVNEKDLSKFIDESSFYDLPEGTKLTSSLATHSGEQNRIRATGASTAAIGVAVKPEEYALYEVVATYVNSTFPGAKASVHRHSDAGLFTVSVTSDDAFAVSSTIKSITSSLKKGVSLSEFVELTNTELAIASEASPLVADLTVKDVSSFTLGKFSYAVVGNTSVLPFADQL